MVKYLYQLSARLSETGSLHKVLVVASCYRTLAHTLSDVYSYMYSVQLIPELDREISCFRGPCHCT